MFVPVERAVGKALFPNPEDIFGHKVRIAKDRSLRNLSCEKSFTTASKARRGTHRSIDLAEFTRRHQHNLSSSIELLLPTAFCHNVLHQDARRPRRYCHDGVRDTCGGQT